MTSEHISRAHTNGPRVFRDVQEIERRRLLLLEPHIAPLTAYVDGLRRETTCEVPYFDPLDGGTGARMLFLFEKPGPMTSRGHGLKQGSGFISRDNNDPTAEATFTFMMQAGIPRNDVLLWNVVPGWNGTRKVTPAEIAAGITSMQSLLPLLPRLQCIVLVGTNAGKARRLLTAMPYPVFTSTHPSPLVKARWPERWQEIRNQWTHAARAVGCGGTS